MCIKERRPLRRSSFLLFYGSEIYNYRRKCAGNFLRIFTKMVLEFLSKSAKIVVAKFRYKIFE